MRELECKEETAYLEPALLSAKNTRLQVKGGKLESEANKNVDE